MPRFFGLSRAVRAVLAMSLSGGLILAAATNPTLAAGGKQLQHVRGTIGWQTAENSADFKPVFGKFDLPDDNFAVTRAASAAVLALPDSSLVSLGQNTNVQVGAFDSSTAGPGSTIQVKGGSLRFDIRRPAGGVANYRFLTTTSAVAVRGTVGLLSFINGVTTIVCVACAADSVTVTPLGGQAVALVTGQSITISASGAVTIGSVAAVTTAAFTAAGVPITSTTGPVAAGLPASSIAGMSAGTATAVGAAAVVTGTAIGIAASQPSPKADNNSDNGSTNTGGATNQPGNLNLNGKGIRVPQAAVTPSPQPAAARPVAPPGSNGPVGRLHP